MITRDERDAKLVADALASYDLITKTYDHWLVIGRCFERGREVADLRSGSKGRKGRGWNTAFSEWLDEHGGGDLRKVGDSKGVLRSYLSKIMENELAIANWRAKLTQAQRDAWSYPETVWKRYQDHLDQEARKAGGLSKGKDDGKETKLQKTEKELAKAIEDNARLTNEVKILEEKLKKLREGGVVIRTSESAYTNAKYLLEGIPHTLLGEIIREVSALWAKAKAAADEADTLPTRLPMRKRRKPNPPRNGADLLASRLATEHLLDESKPKLTPEEIEREVAKLGIEPNYPRGAQRG